MEKEFTMNTHDIQHLVIALISDSANKDGHLYDKPELYKKLVDMFCEMNKLCWEGNEYTIKVIAKA